jgi:virginiamycin B lyase
MSATPTGRFDNSARRTYARLSMLAPAPSAHPADTRRAVALRRAAALATALTLGLVALGSSSAPAATVEHGHPAASDGFSMSRVERGSGTSMWLLQYRTSATGQGEIVKLATADGPLTRYPVPGVEVSGNTRSGVTDITLGPDGALWFIDNYDIGFAARVGRLAPDGSFTFFELPEGLTFLTQIIAGPDGALWFGSPNRIARITTGGVVTEYGTSGSVTALAPGPDGNVWFNAGRQIGRITPSTGSIAYFETRPAPGVLVYGVRGIAPGPDGAMWFTYSGDWPDPPGSGGGWVGRITTAGTITRFQMATREGGEGRIAAGPDGAMWFTRTESGRIGRITMSGGVAECAASSRSQSLFDIAAGPDGKMWFPESLSGMGRVTTSDGVANCQAASGGPGGTDPGPGTGTDPGPGTGTDPGGGAGDPGPGTGTDPGGGAGDPGPGTGTGSGTGSDGGTDGSDAEVRRCSALTDKKARLQAHSVYAKGSICTIARAVLARWVKSKAKCAKRCKLTVVALRTKSTWTCSRVPKASDRYRCASRDASIEFRIRKLKRAR